MLLFLFAGVVHSEEGKIVDGGSGSGGGGGNGDWGNVVLDTGISSGNLAEMTEAEAGADSGRTD